ncbi:hypothetical protein PTKIN_Ptkin02bG0042500 [Pterospermum kingtungense]
MSREGMVSQSISKTNNVQTSIVKARSMNRFEILTTLDTIGDSINVYHYSKDEEIVNQSSSKVINAIVQDFAMVGKPQKEPRIASLGLEEVMKAVKPKKKGLVDKGKSTKCAKGSGSGSLISPLSQ